MSKHSSLSHACIYALFMQDEMQLLFAQRSTTYACRVSHLPDFVWHQSSHLCFRVHKVANMHDIQLVHKHVPFHIIENQHSLHSSILDPYRNIVFEITLWLMEVCTDTYHVQVHIVEEIHLGCCVTMVTQLLIMWCESFLGTTHKLHTYFLSLLKTCQLIE